MKIFFKTFGCRSNIFDTELMKNCVKKIAKNEEEADIIVVNSCTVTNFADRDVKKYINKWSNKRIILTGCGAYTIGQKLFEEKKVDAVLGHKYKEEIDKYLDFRGVKLGDFNFVNKKTLKHIYRTKAFIKIQEGCDFDCAYCILPKVRGHSRSIPENIIIDEIKYLADQGVSEFVLSGINMGSYGKDTNTSLVSLIQKMIEIKGVKRIRLGSLEPSQIQNELIDLVDEGKLERHFHIALQHTSSRMLRIMKRRNRVKQTLELFQKIADKNIALGTDFIVGHPGESDEIWNEALENFKKYPLTHIHIFRFTPRNGTLSSTMKQDVRGDVAKKRSKILKNIVKEQNYKFRKKNQKRPLLVHIEEGKNGKIFGYDEFYNKMQLPNKYSKGEWVKVEKYDVGDINVAK